ncbi:MAG: amine dehydrogenase [bacterium]|nr:amine dehydrogenase [bacterium]MCP5067695.1 amine dehydrogenase [bacterium]
MRTSSSPTPSMVGLLALMLAAFSLAAPLAAEAPREKASVATLPPMGNHSVWVPDRLTQHNLLFDGDSGEVLGMIDSPSLITPKTPLFVRSRNEIYSVDIAHSRGTRGERVDFVSVYDATTLAFKHEIVFPTQSGSSNTSQQYAELIGERFIGVFNQFPNTSVAVIDLVERRFVEEIVTTGCAGVYPIDAHRFAALCGNGTTVAIELDESGSFKQFSRSARFFDVVEDPVAMSAGRTGLRWTFVSFEGQAHTIDYSEGTPVVAASWSLTDEAERSNEWRPGGLQYVAVHGKSGRLFVVMHQGGAGSHKESGPEVWVWDMATQKRVGRFGSPNLTAAFLGSFMGVTEDSFVHDVLNWVLPSGGIHTIAVSQDESPLLFVRNGMLGAIGVLDATTGQSLRTLSEAGLAGPTLRVP